MAKDVAKPRSLKVTDAMWTGWQVAAKAEGASVAALIIKRMEGGRPAIGSKAKVDELEADLVELEKSLVRVADLEDELAKRDATIQAEEAVRRGLREEIADLKRRLATKDGATAQPQRQVSARRHQSGPVLSSAVPTNIAGDVEWSALKGSKK